MIVVIINQLKKTPLIPAVIGIFGFISDLLTPLAPFSIYLFFISTFVLIILISIMLVKKHYQERIAPVLTIFLTLSLLSGVLFSLQQNTNIESKEYGVLASQIPALKSLQSSLGVIQDEVSLIKKNTNYQDKKSNRTNERGSSSKLN
jgi:glucan phosphoethanolaminetransferase (alkaline phosphatase superfamily)